MDIKNILEQVLEGDNVAQLAEKTGISEKKVAQAVESGLPAILEGLNQNTNTKTGASALEKALDKHDGSLLENLAKGDLSSLDLGDGAKIIGHIFGNSEDTVNKELGKEADLTKSQTSSLLSTLAPIVMSALASEKEENGLDSSGLSSLTSTLISSFLGGDSNSNTGSNLLSLVTGLLGNKDDDGDSIVGDILDSLF